MARRRSIIKLPFLKLKINKYTVFNIFGFLLVAGAFILFFSFVNFNSFGRGRLLVKINDFIIERFGGMAIFVPVILLLFSTHFFNSKKIKFIRPNISLGILLIFISLLGVTQSGNYGKLIINNLSYDFSFLGAVIILFSIFLIGLILFLDTSVDLFILFVFNLLKSMGAFVKTYLFRNLFSKEKKFAKGEKGEEKKEEEFIEDKRLEEKKIEEKPKIISRDWGITIQPIKRDSGKTTWVYPPLTLLTDISQKEADRGDVNKNADTIEKTLDSFGIRAQVVEVNYGPSVTQYALKITMGTKLSRITALANDLALALAATTGQVRIEAPIPGRSLVGIEIPNRRPEVVTLKKLLADSLFTANNDPLLVPLGLDVAGASQAASIGKMPHVLIAGATGSGKSVLLNSWITSLIFRTKPEELRLILVDPKRVELTLYNGIPHLLTEVVVEAEKIISALKWTVSEMEARYKAFAKVGVRNLEGYNAVEGLEKKPYIIFVIDELADLMVFAPGDTEDLITRIAQMSRATGIHLVLATQRPSVDVITGLMKANIPTRIAFNVSSMVDSRVIIDMPGAEKLLGRGDMLYLPPDRAKPIRIQGPYVTEKDVNSVVNFLKSQIPHVEYTDTITTQPVTITSKGGTVIINGGEKDPLFAKAVEIILQYDKASASLLQRRLSIGYARAARLLDQLEAAGYVGPAEGSKPREVIKRATEEAG
ncbi:MAG: DNA translocase FtsK [Microgenomates group bacterium]